MKGLSTITLMLGLVVVGCLLLVRLFIYNQGAKSGSASVCNVLSAGVDLTKIPIKGKMISEARIKIIHDNGKLVGVFLEANSTEIAIRKDQTEVEGKSDEK